jgi:hypothetical protein
MPSITSANVANAIAKLVAVDALPALVGNLVMGNLVNRDYESTVAQAGDTVNVPIPPKLVANNLADGGSVQPQNPSAGNGQVVLNTHAEATFLIPDVMKVLAVPDLLKLYMQPAMVALAEKIEGDLFGTYAQFTANDPVGAGGVALTEASVDAAEKALFTARVPVTEQKYLVLDATQYALLRQNPRFVEYPTGKDAGLKAHVDGPVGKFKDFFVFRSQFVKQTGTNPVVTHNLAFSRNALALVMRRLPHTMPGLGVVTEYAELGNFGMRVSMSYRPDTLSQQLTVDVLYGIGVLRNNHAVLVES